MVHATCAALHCLSSSHADKDLKFHQFPHDAERRNIWITACKRTDVIDRDWDFFKHKYLCSKHFQKCMYSKKDRLKKNAIPSLHLSEKPIQHDSSTQTVESIKYVNQQSENDVSILYVKPNVELSSTTSYTQTEDSSLYDIKHLNIKKEVITHTKIEQDVEMKTETEDDVENSDIGAFEEDKEIKIEIVENEILPLVQSVHTLQSVDLEKIKDGGTLPTQSKHLQEIDQVLTVHVINRTATNPLNTTMMPILKRKMDESIQTDRVIVLSQNDDGSLGSINPEECECNRNLYFDMTRLEFYGACSKFLSADFALTVKIRMNLDDITSGRVKARAGPCVELNTAGRKGVVAPEVVIAGTETVADSAEADMDAIGRVAASTAASSASCAHSTMEPDVQIPSTSSTPMETDDIVPPTSAIPFAVPQTPHNAKAQRQSMYRKRKAAERTPAEAADFAKAAAERQRRCKQRRLANSALDTGILESATVSAPVVVERTVTAQTSAQRQRAYRQRRAAQIVSQISTPPTHTAVQPEQSTWNIKWSSSIKRFKTTR